MNSQLSAGVIDCYAGKTALMEGRVCIQALSLVNGKK